MMRVIVTRPMASAQRSAQKLVRLGYAPVLLPVTEAVHEPQVAVAALQLPHRALAFTSAEAVRALSGIDLSPHRHTPVFAVGQATGQAALQAGFVRVEQGTGTGEELARMLATAGVQDLLYLAGTPRSPAFEHGLAGSGIRFHTAVVYAMKPAAWTSGQQQQLSSLPQAVLLYSRETARHFFDRIGPHLADGPDNSFHVFCLSPQVAEAVPENNVIALHVAGKPEEDELLRLLSSCLGTKIR